MPKQTHVPVVRKWCLSLAVLSAVTMSRDEAEMRMAAYVPLLLMRFPDGAFTADSLEHVARACRKGFPTYGELCAALGEWWADRKPLPVLAALPAPDERPLLQRDPPTPETIEHVRRVAAEAIAALRADTAPAVRREPTPRYLTAAQLDIANPLPNGRKRAHAA